MMNFIGNDQYADKVKKETKFFEKLTSFQDLPDAFHYWTNKYLKPEVQRVFGTTGAANIHVKSIIEQQTQLNTRRILSIGCGNGELELLLARKLKEDTDIVDFQLDCIELSQNLCNLAQKKANSSGLKNNVHFICADLNQWKCETGVTYDFVIANQILHHVIELEHLILQIKTAIGEKGVFFVRDVIGRNGHLLWPEQAEIVNSLWQNLPKNYRYHHLFKQVHENYPDLDCSKDGFEGIRAQDILLLLTENFNFRRFVAFGGIIERFTGRKFGHNYDISDPNVKLFIDSLWLINYHMIKVGHLKPTNMIGEMSVKSSKVEIGFEFSPEFCLRPEPFSS